MKPNVTANAGARRVPRALVFGALLFALLGAGVYSFVSLSSANRWLRHTDEVRVSVALLGTTMLDAETGLRGYLFTGNDGFLASYQHAHERWRGQLAEVRRLTQDNPEQQARVHALESLIAKGLGGFAPERALAERDRARAELLPMLEEHKRTIDAARALLASMEAEEASLDHMREAEATRRWGITAVLLIGGSLAFVSIVAALAVRSRSLEMRRRRADEEQRLLQGCSRASTTGSRCSTAAASSCSRTRRPPACSASRPRPR